MSWFTALTRGNTATRLAQHYAEAPIRSPFASGPAGRVVLADITGIRRAGVTRAEAMKVPAIVKGRGLIMALARQPLATFVQDTEVATVPDWLARTDTDQAPLTRMTWTLDDLIFHGLSLWAVEREAGKIIDAYRMPFDWWQISENGEIQVKTSETAQFQTISEGSVILFESQQEGLLSLADDLIKGARDQDAAWQKRVESPIPLVELHETDSMSEIDDEEAQDLVDKWETARRAGGATGFTPAGIQLIAHSGAGTDLFENGRNAVRIDVANFLNIPASMLDGSANTASLTYSTAEGKRNELVDYCLNYWAQPIESRLSMDDVCAPGERIAFDVSYFAEPQQPNNNNQRD